MKNGEFTDKKRKSDKEITYNVSCQNIQKEQNVKENIELLTCNLNFEGKILTTTGDEI